MLCKNCNEPIHGSFCSNCGEKTSYERITLKRMVSDAVIGPFKEHRKSLPYTIVQLTVRPGLYIKRYVEGERNLLYAPDKFLLLIGAVVIFLSTLRYHFFSNEFTDTDTAVNMSLLQWLGLSNQQKLLQEFFLYAESYGTILNIIAIPVFALFSHWVFKNKKHTYGEHLVLNTYITAQQLFYLILLVPALEFFPGNKYEIMTLYSFIIVIYNLVVLVQFFNAPIVKEIFLSLIAIILSYIVQFFLNLAIYAAFGNIFRFLDDYKVL
jgi:hypothetical protein